MNGHINSRNSGEFNRSWDTIQRSKSIRQFTIRKTARTPLKMSVPKRQHWVPRFYLRYFATPESKKGAEQVWIFHRKHEDGPKLASINNVAVGKHLYSPRQPDGSRDVNLETKLCGLEGALAKLWPLLVNDFVDLGAEGIRKGIALYLATQSLRHPDGQDWVGSFRQSLLNSVRDKPRDVDGRLPTTNFLVGGERITVDPDQWEELQTAGPEFDANHWVSLVETEAIGLAEILLAKRWSVVFIDEPLFVTSDYPFFVASPEHKRNQLGAHDAVIVFPLSPTRILCMDEKDEPGNRYYPIPNSEADHYNLLTWVNTESFMISPRNIYDVLSGIARLQSEYDAKGDDVSSEYVQGYPNEGTADFLNVNLGIDE